MMVALLPFMVAMAVGWRWLRRTSDGEVVLGVEQPVTALWIMVGIAWAIALVWLAVGICIGRSNLERLLGPQEE